jgi:hypothetical protein
MAWNIESYDDRLCRIRDDDNFAIGSIDLKVDSDGDKTWSVEIHRKKGMQGGPFNSKREAVAFVQGIETAMRTFGIGIRREM